MAVAHVNEPDGWFGFKLGLVLPIHQSPFEPVSFPKSIMLVCPEFEGKNTQTYFLAAKTSDGRQSWVEALKTSRLAARAFVCFLLHSAHSHSTSEAMSTCVPSSCRSSSATSISLARFGSTHHFSFMEIYSLFEGPT